MLAMRDKNPILTPNLPIGRYRLAFVALEPVHLPPYAGSAWRGVFGHSLRQAVCVTRLADCALCPLLHECTYTHIFETRFPEALTDLKRYDKAPHPFVLEPVTLGSDGQAQAFEAELRPQTLAPGDLCHLELTLFGKANAQLALFVHTLAQAGQRGLGITHGQLRLVGVTQQVADCWQTLYRASQTLAQLHPLPIVPLAVPPPPPALRLHFQTPIRLKREGEYVRPQTFALHDLLRNLVRRISLLTLCHVEAQATLDIAALVQQARNLPVQVRAQTLRWQELDRYSNRQQRALHTDGLLGTVELAVQAEAWSALWPYLWLGQWTYAGSLTSMGLGRYRIIN